jgi:hypothetical protein
LTVWGAKGLLEKTNHLFSIPIIGTANCGPATIFAEQNFQGFLKVSNKLVGRSTSRCLKHLFDKKPAEEFLFIIDHLHEMVRYPDKIYLNKEAKCGCFCFVKIINGVEYFCSLEIKKTPPAIYGEARFGISEYGEEKETEEIQVATAFRMRKKYIKNYTLLWDWGNGNPHRSALDTPEESTNAPQ